MPPYRKTKEDIKYKPTFGFSKPVGAPEATVPTTATPAPVFKHVPFAPLAALAAPAPLAPLTAPAAPAVNPCTHYNTKKANALMPFYYQKGQLHSVYPTNAPIQARLLSVPEISKKIDHRFRQDAAAATKEAIETLLERIGRGHVFHDDLRAFFGNVRIYTKREFAKELTRGFQWTLKHLKQQPWGMMTEQFISTLETLENTPTAPVANFKSTEWIGNLFLQHCAKKKPYVAAGEAQCRLGCRIDSTKLAFVEPGLILDRYGIYVLLDDAAYSGQQKALVLTTMLRSIHSRRRVSTILVMIPYRTKMAMDRFRLALWSHQHANPGCTVVQETRADEVVFTLTQTFGASEASETAQHTVRIHLWTGGTLMDDCQTILEHRVGLTGARLAAVSQWVAYQGTGGATLTLFEHKVPDFLSLNSMFGNLFKEKMGHYYALNPPYKVVLLDGSRAA